MSGVDHYPLSWPDAFPRSRAREKGAFRTTLPAALNNVETSLKAFGRDSGKAVSAIILSSNVSLGRQKPEDPGVAAWFTWDGMQVCIPVDRYSTPQANLQAIHHVLEARRTELRHGTFALVRATMKGFLALPGRAGERHWSTILGLTPSRSYSKADVDGAYRQLAKKAHPDHGGSDTAMADLNRARDAALKEISG